MSRCTRVKGVQPHAAPAFIKFRRGSGGRLFCEWFLGGGPKGAVFLEPLADGSIHTDVVVHGMSLDCARSWTRSRTSCGQCQFTDWTRTDRVCGPCVDAVRTEAWLSQGHCLDVARTPLDSCLASTRMIHLMLRGCFAGRHTRCCPDTARLILGSCPVIEPDTARMRCRT